MGAPALMAPSWPTQAWMSSLSRSGRSLPKSPVLEQPDKTRSATAANTADCGLVSYRHRARGDIGGGRSAASCPSTATVFRRGRRLRFGTLGMRIRITLDPDHGENE